MSIPDRSKYDDNIAQSLSILGAVGNAVLVERNYLLAETAAELASDLYAAQGQADDDHGTICRLAERLAEMGAALHTAHCERDTYRRQLAMLQARVFGGIEVRA